MANFTSIFLIVSTSIAIFAITPSFGYQIFPSQSNEVDDNVAPTSSISDILHDKCVLGFSRACATQLYEGIFKYKDVTSECCSNLKSVGKPCLDRLLKRILGYPMMWTLYDESKVLTNGEEVWNTCYEVGLVAQSPN